MRFVETGRGFTLSRDAILSVQDRGGVAFCVLKDGTTVASEYTYDELMHSLTYEIVKSEGYAVALWAGESHDPVPEEPTYCELPIIGFRVSSVRSEPIVISGEGAFAGKASIICPDSTVIDENGEAFESITAWHLAKREDYLARKR